MSNYFFKENEIEFKLDSKLYKNAIYNVKETIIDVIDAYHDIEETSQPFYLDSLIKPLDGHTLIRSVKSINDSEKTNDVDRAYAYIARWAIKFTSDRFKLNCVNKKELKRIIEIAESDVIKKQCEKTDEVQRTFTTISNGKIFYSDGFN